MLHRDARMGLTEADKTPRKTRERPPEPNPLSLECLDNVCIMPENYKNVV